MTPRAFSFESGRIGPQLLVFGAVHGNETCGTIALARLKLELDLGLLELRCGTLTLVPVCNPLAYVLDRRYVQENLNRIISRRLPVSSHPEGDFAGTLMDLIDGCDVLLDLHSYTSGTAPFVFLDYPSTANTALADAVGIPDRVVGWAELYAGAPGLNAGDTTQYANETGKYGILIECGQHRDPAAIDVAYVSTRRTLAHLGMAEARPGAAAAMTVSTTRVTGIVIRDRPGVFAEPWHHLQSVESGTPLVRYEDGFGPDGHKRIARPAARSERRSRRGMAIPRRIRRLTLRRGCRPCRSIARRRGYLSPDPR